MYAASPIYNKGMMHFEMGCLMNLSDAVTVVKGVGMRMKEKLERLGIKTVEDLISYYPRRYEDWTRITSMADLSYEMETAVYGTVVEIREVHPRRNLSILTVTLVDGTGAVNLVYFNQPWKKEQFAHGSNILAYGKIEYNYRNGRYPMRIRRQLLLKRFMHLRNWYLSIP